MLNKRSFDDAGAVVFGAPHGTPYEGIDNSVFRALCSKPCATAVEEDWLWLDHWDYDLGGPLLAERDFAVVDAGDLETTSSWTVWATGRKFRR